LLLVVEDHRTTRTLERRDETMEAGGVFLVWISLVLLIVLGVILTAIGGMKVRQRIRLGFDTRGSVMTFSLQSLILTLGLLFISYGAFTLLNFIWRS